MQGPPSLHLRKRKRTGSSVSPTFPEERAPLRVTSLHSALNTGKATWWSEEAQVTGKPHCLLVLTVGASHDM